MVYSGIRVTEVTQGKQEGGEFDIPPKISGKAFSAQVDTHMCVSVFVAVSEYRGDLFNYFLSKARKHGRCV